jgi:hypothetical protein
MGKEEIHKRDTNYDEVLYRMRDRSQHRDKLQKEEASKAEKKMKG